MPLTEAESSSDDDAIDFCNNVPTEQNVEAEIGCDDGVAGTKIISLSGHITPENKAPVISVSKNYLLQNALQFARSFHIHDLILSPTVNYVP